MPTVDVVDLNNQKVGSARAGRRGVRRRGQRGAAVRSGAALSGGPARGHAQDQDAPRSGRSGKKLWKQKGTGRARMGSIRSPLWRHGGTVHGPQPRDYSYKLPRKMLLGALRSALSAKVRDGELKVVQAFDLDDHKTKNAMQRRWRKLEAETHGAAGRTTATNRNLTLGVAQSEGRDAGADPRSEPSTTCWATSSVLLTEAAARKFSEALAK